MNNPERMKNILAQLRATEDIEFRISEEALLREANRKESDDAGIAIKVMSIFGGLLTTLIFLAFMALAGFYDDEGMILCIGLIFIVLAVSLNRIFNLLIIDTSVISMYIIGFCLLGFGLAELDYSGNEICTNFILIALASLIIAQNFVLAFVCVLILNGSFIAMILINERIDMIHVYNTVNTLLLASLFLFEPVLLRSGKIISRLCNPLRIGLIFSLLAGLFFISSKWWMDDELWVSHVWPSSIPICLSMLYLLYQVLGVFGKTGRRDIAIAFAAAVPLLLSLAFLPAIAGSMLIMLASFRIGYRTGLVTGVAAFIYFTVQFYYDLNFTLLTKSLILFGSGIILLACFVVAQLTWKSDEKI